MEEKEEEKEEEEEEGKEEEEEVKMVDSVGVGEKGGCLSFPRNMCVSRKGADANLLGFFLQLARFNQLHNLPYMQMKLDNKI